MNESPVRFLSIFKGGALKRGAAFGFILLAALFAFEAFNYTTTQFALADILGSNLRFMGVQWATILAIAFCGIDFAGIARLFTPEQSQDGPAEVWYLFSAWLLAAAMNAVLTWWGVSVAIRTHQELSSLIISQSMLTKVVPIFVALMVWLIRVLIIGTFSMAGERMFSIGVGRSPIMANSLRARPLPRSAVEPEQEQPRPARPDLLNRRPDQVRPEPTYHPANLAARPPHKDQSIRR